MSVIDNDSPRDVIAATILGMASLKAEKLYEDGQCRCAYYMLKEAAQRAMTALMGGDVGEIKVSDYE